MKKIITLLLLFIFQISFSQDLEKQLWGDWVPYKVERKDGSKLYDRKNNDSSYIKFSFREDNKMIISNSPVVIGNTINKFSIEKNIIRLSNDQFNVGNKLGINDNTYTIEKVTKDTLIIVENFSAPDDILKRYYCLNQFKYIDEMKSTYKNISHYVANRYCTPIIKKGGIDFKHAQVSFELNGYMIFNLINKKIDVVIESGNLDDQNLKEFIKMLEGTYDKWHLYYFDQFKTIKLPFFFKNEYTPKLRTFNYAFAINTLPNPDRNQLGKTEQSFDYYKTGLEAFKDSKFEKAIECFTKSYEYDNYNIEALYSRAAIYYHIGKKAKACADWKILVDLGQKRGIDAYNQYCN